MFCYSLGLYVRTLYTRVNLINVGFKKHSTRSVPEFIDQIFARTSSKRSFSVIENDCFGLVFAKTGSLNSGTVKRLHSCAFFAHSAQESKNYRG
jgi:hypothetical protein